MNRVVYFKGEGVSERPRSIQKVFYVWRKNHDEGGEGNERVKSTRKNTTWFLDDPL